MPAMPVSTLPLRKKALFATVVVVIFLALFEGLLSLLGVQPVIVTEDPLVGFSATMPLFVPDDANTNAAQRVTAPNKRGLFNTQRFADPKPVGTYRIFCLGGSTTYGHPYDDRTSFAGWLRQLLPCADPSQNWEVINAGGISYASYREASLMEELCRYEPDLFIVFTGHNEFLEHRTYGDLRDLPTPLKGLSGTLARTRTYAALRQVIKPPAPPTKRFVLPAEVDAVLDHTVGPSAYHRDDQLRDQIVTHFEFNLRRMAQLARAAGAEIVFVTPVSNLKDCSPFKSEHRVGLSPAERAEFADALRRGRRLQSQGDRSGAMMAYNYIQGFDETYAEVPFRRAQCLFESQEFDAALGAFLRARDEDICPLRAITPLVETVREAATAEGAPLVDFERWLEAESQHRYGHPILGREMFLDHVHPTIEVNGMLAMLLIDKLDELQIARTEASWREHCKATATQQVLDQLQPADHATAHRMVAKVLSWAGKIEEAGPAALAALAIEPEDRESLFIAGAYEKFLGHDRQGNELYRRALEKEIAEHPEDVEARQFLAKTLFELGEVDLARQHAQKALKLRPDSAEAQRLLDQLDR